LPLALSSWFIAPSKSFAMPSNNLSSHDTTTDMGVLCLPSNWKTRDPAHPCMHTPPINQDLSSDANLREGQEVPMLRV
jgi:hypothetical protein